MEETTSSKQKGAGSHVLAKLMGTYCRVRVLFKCLLLIFLSKFGLPAVKIVKLFGLPTVKFSNCLENLSTYKISECQIVY